MTDRRCSVAPLPDGNIAIQGEKLLDVVGGLASFVLHAFARSLLHLGLRAFTGSPPSFGGFGGLPVVKILIAFMVILDLNASPLSAWCRLSNHSTSVCRPLLCGWVLQSPTMAVVVKALDQMDPATDTIGMVRRPTSPAPMIWVRCSVGDAFAYSNKWHQPRTLKLDGSSVLTTGLVAVQSFRPLIQSAIRSSFKVN